MERFEASSGERGTPKEILLLLALDGRNGCSADKTGTWVARSNRDTAALESKSGFLPAGVENGRPTHRHQHNSFDSLRRIRRRPGPHELTHPEVACIIFVGLVRDFRIEEKGTKIGRAHV